MNDGNKIVVEPVGGGSTEMRTLGTLDPHRVVIRNGRNVDTSLDGEGFQLAWHETAVTDFFDEAQIRDVYYPEMIELIKFKSGAKRVVVFDHTLRTADDADRTARKIREVVPRVHNDYTEWSGPQRVRDLLPDEPTNCCRGISQSFRSGARIRYPVETFPLALCDAHTFCRTI